MCIYDKSFTLSLFMNSFVRRITTLVFLIFITSNVLFAQKYWRGGGGNSNWSNNLNWSSTALVFTPTTAPTSADNVFFDGSSFLLPGKAVILNVAATCANMDWTGAANAPVFDMSSNTLTMNGSIFTLISGMSLTNPQPITFTNTGNITIETGGATKTFSDLTFTGTASRTINIDISSGGTKGFGVVTVGDNSTININNNGSYKGMSLGNSTTSSLTIVGAFYGPVSMGTNTTANWSCLSQFNNSVTVSGTSVAGVNFANATYGSTNNITGKYTSAYSAFNTGSFSTFTGGNTNITTCIIQAGTAVIFKNNGTVTGNLFQDITMGAGSTINFPTGGSTSTVSGTVSTAGLCSNPVNINSDNGSSPAKVKFGTFSNPNNININNIDNTGGAAVNILSGTGANNINITVKDGTTAATGRTLYWVGGTGNWSGVCSHWATSSGGSNLTSAPTQYDNVIFNNNSFPAAGQTVILDVAGACNNMDWTGSTNTPTFNMSSNPLTINGNIINFIGGMSLTNPQPITFTNTGNITIETGGATKTFSDLTFTGTASRTINIDISSGGTKGFGIVTVGDNSTININNNGSYKGMSLGNSTTSSLTIVGAFYGPVSMGTNTTANWSCLSQFNNSVTVSGTSVAGVNFANATYGSTNNITGKYTSAYSAFNTGSFSTFTGGNTNITTCIIQAGTAVIFKNNGTVTGNLFQDITMGAGSTINFPTGGSTSTVSGTVSTAGLCSNPVNINSDNGSSPAKVKFGTFSNPNNININNIDNTGGAAVNILSGTGANNINITVKDGTTAATGRTLYWVGGTGNWSGVCSHWATSSGGSNLTSAPTQYDNVIFNNNSFPAAGQTVTLDVAGACNNMDWTGSTNTPTFNMSSNPLTINGNIINFIGGMSLTNPQPITFTNTGNITIETGGATKTFSDLTFTGTASRTINIDISSGGTKGFGVVTVGDNSTININNNGSYKGMSLGNSTTSSLTIVGAFYGPVSMGTNTTANWSCLSQFNNSVTVSGTSVAGVNFANATYGSTNNITGKYTSAYSAFNAGSFSTFTGGNTNITTCIIQAGTAVIFKNNGTVTGNLFQDITMGAGSTINFPTGGSTSTVSGTVSTAGLCSNPVNINSDNGSSRAKVKFGTFSNPNNININNIDNTGGAAVNILSGTGANNINITIKNGTTAATGRTLYWVGGTGNWSDCTHWAIVSGGAVTVFAPLTFDNVIFDNNSFSALGQVVNVDLNTSSCNNLTWKNTVTNSPNINFNNATILNINGSMTLDASLGAVTDPSNTGYFNFISTTAQNITTAGKTLPQVQFNNSGAWTMLDAMTVNRSVTVNKGTFNSNNFTLTCSSFFSSGILTRKISMQGSKFILTGVKNIFDISNDKNLNWDASGFTATTNIQATNGTDSVAIYIGVGNGAKTFPDFLFESIPQAANNGPSDVGIYVSNSGNRLTFKNITLSNTNGSQMLINGTSPMTFANITLPANFNTGPVGAYGGQRQIQGSSNIYNGNITIGANSSIGFYGSNTFNGTINIATSQDVDNAYLFAGDNTFNSNVDIILNNTRGSISPTMTFGANGGNISFTNNSTFTIHGNSTITRFGSSASSTAGATLYFDTGSQGQFVGGNTTDSFLNPLGGSAAYNLNGTLTLNGAQCNFYNTVSDIFNNVIINVGSKFLFTSNNTAGLLSTVNGTFTVNGVCNATTIVGSIISGTKANVTFANAQTWAAVLVNDLNIVSGSMLVTVNGGVNNNSGTVPSTLVFNSSGTPVLYWVGGDPTNISKNNFWRDPRNWAVDISIASQRMNGGSCIPDASTVVIFTDKSFSSLSSYISSSPFYKNSIQLSQVYVDDTLLVANVKDMIWTDIVNANTGGNLPTLTSNPLISSSNIAVYGNLRFAASNKMNNTFKGTFTFNSGSGITSIIDANGKSNGPSVSNLVTKFSGPVIFQNTSGAWQLNSNIIINANANGKLTLSGGFLTVIDSLGTSRNITLDGDWAVFPPKKGSTGIPQAIFNSGSGKIIFNGQNSNNTFQKIIAGPLVVQGAITYNSFNNIEINRQKVGSKPSVANSSANYGSNADVVIFNSYSNILSDSTTFAFPVTAGDPGKNTTGTAYLNNSADNSGITVKDSIIIRNGNLWDKGFQIKGNASGHIKIYPTGALHLGSVTTWSGAGNNTPLTTVFPRNIPRANITLDQGSTIVYNGQSHQDVSLEPVYSNLYFEAPLQCNTSASGTTLEMLTGSCTRKRLAMPIIGSAVTSNLTVNDTLTIESGILFADNGIQVTGIAARSYLKIYDGGAMVLGSYGQVVAATIGTSTGPKGSPFPVYDPVGYSVNSAPVAPITGTYAASMSATQFALNFDDPRISLDPKSIVVYFSSTPNQLVRGLTTPGYGHLLTSNPTSNSPVLIQKNLQPSVSATKDTRVQGYLIIQPNSNLIDNGYQISGLASTGATANTGFVMNNSLLASTFNTLFNNAAPTSSGTTAQINLNNPVANGTNTIASPKGVLYQGSVNIDVAGLWTFYVQSDDGANLYIDNKQVLFNDYPQSCTERQVSINLSAGSHPITCSYYNGVGNSCLRVSWLGPAGSAVTIKNEIPTTSLTNLVGSPGISYNFYGNITFSWAGGANSQVLNLIAPFSKILPDLTQQLTTSTLTVGGLSQMVIGNSTVATKFPLNYLDKDIYIELGTNIVYNSNLPQDIRALNDGAGTPAGSRQYAALTLTNSNSTKVNKTLMNVTGFSPGGATIRDSLVVNPNNNFIDNGFQISGLFGKLLVLKNTSLALNPATNTGTVGTTGESRITLGTSSVATTFPAGFSQTTTDVNLEPNTSIVYNAGVPQQVAGLKGTNTNGKYANLYLTNPSLTVTSPLSVAKTLQTNAITVRGNLNIYPNNIFYDNGFQVTGTSNQTFNMFNATLPSDFVTNVANIGITGESRYVIGNATASTLFPGNYRIGNAGSSDINFEPGSTIVYNSGVIQQVQGLGGLLNTTYSNLTLTNPANSSTLINKNLITNGVVSNYLIRDTLVINSNNNFVDNGLQINGTTGRKFYMKSSIASSPIGIGNIGLGGLSQLTLGTNAVSTNFPGNYTTFNGTDINFDLGTNVVYNSGIAQPIQGIITTASLSSKANYANVILANATATIALKTMTNSDMRIRGNLTIGAYNNLDVSASNFNIFLQGDWIGTNTGSVATGSEFTSRLGTVTFEGGNLQTLTHNNTTTASADLDFNPETSEDFFSIVIDKTPSNNVVLNSLVAVSNDVTFKNGYIISGNLTGPALTIAPNKLLVFRSLATATVNDPLMGGDPNLSHTIGAVRKTGKDDFTFPIGTGIVYRPDGISSIVNRATSFITQYFPQSPKSAGFPSNLRQDPPLTRVSGVEFWMLNRERSAGATSNANVTLSWNDTGSGPGYSGGVANTGVGNNGNPNSYLDLRVARWNQSSPAQWRDLGGQFYTGNNQQGTVTSRYTTSLAYPTVGKVDNFSPFTLASLTVFNPLPVTLVDFEAVPVRGKIDLHWKTSYELNTKVFIVEKSSDGKNFSPVTSVNAKGNSNSNNDYYAVDEKPFNGTSYYRLKIIDFDGVESYSKQIAVRIDGLDVDEITFYPNPSDGSKINFKYNTPYTLSQVIDMTGKSVQFKVIEKMDSQMSVEFSEKLAAATYIAILVREDGKQLKKIKFIVN